MTSQTAHNEKIVDQHTQQAPAYAALTQSMATDRTAALRAITGAGPDDDLLDLACGPGSLTLDLAPHVGSATGLDLTPAMLEQARAAQEKRGIEGVRWAQGDAADLPFPDNSFTLVTSSAAFHHFDSPAKVLSEMARVCRPGGRVVVMDVTPEAGKTAAYDRMERMRDPSHGHAHSIEELAALGRDQGMSEPVTQTRMTGPMPYEAVLATSFPEDHSREELLGQMREDAESGEDRLGFKAELADGKVLVTYPMSTLVWTIA
jgi:ubiquinone/menaquinone biosynthesis C-methylase UbiE